MPKDRTALDPTDPRNQPAYSIAEASHCLGVPPSTLRAWVLGQRNFRPVLRLPHPRESILSFINLVEAHVLESIRRHHQVSLQKVRRALDFLNRSFRSRHPLVEHAFETDGLNLFVQRYGDLINVSTEGQLELRQLVEAYLRRIERDSYGQVIRLYPFTRKTDLDQPKVIVIDPLVAFGRPVLIGTGIPTSVIAERYKAGDSIAALVADYERSQDEIEEAIRCELQAA